KAYRIPATPGGMESPTELAKETVPISFFTVRSIFVRPEPAERVAAGKTFTIEGLAMDSGKGIASLAVSTDGGRTWNDANLDREMGKYAWRRWRYRWKPPARGTYR